MNSLAFTVHHQQSSPCSVSIDICNNRTPYLSEFSLMYRQSCILETSDGNKIKADLDVMLVGAGI